MAISSSENNSIRGSQKVSVDGRGRVSLPIDARSAWQLDEGSSLVLSAIGKGCIGIYQPDVWEGMIEKINEETTNPDREIYKEMANALCFDEKVDSAGRIMLDEILRDFSGIKTGSKKGAVLAGQMNHFKLWSEDKFREQILAYQRVGVSGSWMKNE